MILTDREIQIALEHGSIIIDPRPDAAAYSSTSVDLTLDKALSEFRDLPGGVQTVIDPTARVVADYRRHFIRLRIACGTACAALW